VPGAGGDESELVRRVSELEQRMARLEQRFERTPAVPTPPSPHAAQVALIESAGVVPVVGRAVLAMAGAYVLRALTESHLLRPEAGVLGGILYGMFWLVWTARLPAARHAEIALYGVTSALVIGPLVWEATLRMRAISTWSAASVLLLFTGLGLILSSVRSLSAVAWTSILTGVAAAAALLIGSHDVLPFLLLLVLIAAAVEIAACLGRGFGGRWVAAAAANLAVLLVTYLVSHPRGLPESYVPISRSSVAAAQLALPGIYVSSTFFRTLVRRTTIETFEAAQIAAVFLLALGGGLRLGGMVPAIAALAGAGSAAFYAAGAFSKGRNSAVYRVLGFLLAAAGIGVALPAGQAALAWFALAIGFLWFGRTEWLWQGGAYLFCGLVASGGLARATAGLLGGTDAGSGAWPLLAPAAVSVACFFLAVRGGGSRSAVRTALAAAVCWLLAAAVAGALAASYHAVFGALASHAYCGAARTAVLAGAALLLAWAGSRWRGFDIRPLVYPLMALGAYRLLTIDLRQDDKAALVLSLLVYGGALILIPRLLRPVGTAPS